MSSISIYSTEIILTQSKTCSKCNTDRPLDLFYKSKASKDGYKARCKLCAKVADSEYNIRLWESQKQARILARKHYKPRKQYEQEYRQANRAVLNAHEGKRRATKLKATPIWAELDLIKQLYIDCKALSKLSSILHHVDHIVPLKSKIVCGLHCIANLRIILATENHSKNNKHWPDMW